jgi:hypothetical protein
MNETAAAATIDTLERAKQALLERGMCKCHLVNHRGEVCSRGALLVTVDSDMTTSTACSLLDRVWHSLVVADKALAVVARRLYPERCNGLSAVVAFNNHPDTTLDELVEVFDAAIVHVKEEAQ